MVEVEIAEFGEFARGQLQPKSTNRLVLRRSLPGWTRNPEGIEQSLLSVVCSIATSRVRQDHGKEVGAAGVVGVEAPWFVDNRLIEGVGGPIATGNQSLVVGADIPLPPARHCQQMA